MRKYSTKERIIQARQQHGDKYDYSAWPDDIRQKDFLHIKCKKHGVEFIQQLKVHLRGSTGCHLCTNINTKKSIDERISQAISVHGDKYDYSAWPDDISLLDEVDIKCLKHDIVFKQQLKCHLKGNIGCNICSKEKQKKTNLERYGVENPLQNKDVKEKVKQTNLERYGVENPFQSEIIQNKINDIILEKYGVERPIQSIEMQEKIKQTNLERYGCEYPHSNDVVREKFLSTMKEKYGEKHALQIKTFKDKVKKTSIEKYGVENPTSLNMFQDKIKKTSIEKYGVDHHTKKHISSESLMKLNNKKWLIEQHHNKQRTLNDISNELNVDGTTVGNYFKKYNIDVKYYFVSDGEKDIALFLSKHNILTSDRTTISPYELDIYIPEHKLAIEYCGLYWHSEQAGKDKHYHKRKHDLCQEKGIQLITIFEDEWLEHQEQVKSKISSLLNDDKRQIVYARKTQIVEVSKKDKSKFFNETHIQGDGPSSINIGLVHNGELVACMCFYKQQDKHYLNRYATSHRVTGGFSKLLKYFQKNYEWKQIVSFADLRWSNGNLYEKTGWTLDKVLDPDYSYSVNQKRYHKFNFRRKNLHKFLSNFDPSLSERENCNLNDILRIWDCGKQRWVMNN